MYICSYDLQTFNVKLDNNIKHNNIAIKQYVIVEYKLHNVAERKT